MSKDKIIVTGLNISKERLAKVDVEIKADVTHVGSKG